jgi:hypothetical protein
LIADEIREQEIESWEEQVNFTTRAIEEVKKKPAKRKSTKKLVIPALKPVEL